MFLAISIQATGQFYNAAQGVAMNRFSQITVSISDKVNRMISRTEAENPGMKEVAAMVYVGDIVVLREQRHRRRADGWGLSRYSCDSHACRRLP